MRLSKKPFSISSRIICTRSEKWNKPDEMCKLSMLCYTRHVRENIWHAPGVSRRVLFVRHGRMLQKNVPAKLGTKCDYLSLFPIPRTLHVAMATWGARQTGGKWWWRGSPSTARAVADGNRPGLLKGIQMHPWAHTARWPWPAHCPSSFWSLLVSVSQTAVDTPATRSISVFSSVCGRCLCC